MSLLLYTDHHVRRAVVAGLRLRGVDVLTAREDGAAQLPDAALLNRASALGRALFSQDRDLLIEAARRQASGEHFCGVIFAAQLGITIGKCIDDLELIAKIYDPSDIADSVEYLPL